jgi:hypothetical protein
MQTHHCPDPFMPFIVTFQPGHHYNVAAVDPNAFLCGGANDPKSAGCVRYYNVSPFIGNAMGITSSWTVR